MKAEICCNMFLSKVMTLRYFYYALRKISGEHIVAALSVRPSVSQSVSQPVRTSVRPIRVRPITLLFEVAFRNYFTELKTMLRRRVSRNIGSLPWRSSSQCDLAAKSCPAYNFVIWSRISKLFHRNDHHVKMTCCAQHLGRYLEGRPAALSVRPLVSQSVIPSVRLSVRPICVGPITSLFEVGFRNYFTEMSTMLRRRVARNIWVPTLKVKVTVRPCSKIVSGL